MLVRIEEKLCSANQSCTRHNTAILKSTVSAVHLRVTTIIVIYWDIAKINTKIWPANKMAFICLVSSSKIENGYHRLEAECDKNK